MPSDTDSARRDTNKHTNKHQIKAVWTLASARRYWSNVFCIATGIMCPTGSKILRWAVHRQGMVFVLHKPGEIYSWWWCEYKHDNEGVTNAWTMLHISGTCRASPLCEYLHDYVDRKMSWKIHHMSGNCTASVRCENCREHAFLSDAWQALHAIRLLFRHQYDCALVVAVAVVQFYFATGQVVQYRTRKRRMR